MPRVALHTLGCKVNQYETQKIADDFKSRGFDLVDFSDEADVYVINTCTVTQTADSKSRQAARSVIHRNPKAKVVLTGCYAETSPDDAQRLDGVHMVFGNDEKDKIADRVASLFDSQGISIRNLKSDIRNRTRALLKIQDGCNQFCSYCAVPLARPMMSSRAFGEVISEAEDLARNGYKEIVLTGIRLGCYQDGEVDLTGLLKAISQIQGIERIRLSSIELTDIPEGLLDALAQNRKVCRHLHIPLQSGDDETLRRMNRPYTTAQFAEFVQKARTLVPGIAITTDIMVGFPGETEEEFGNTFRFTQDVGFSRAHIFRFSPRRGTAAAEMTGEVLSAEKDSRSTKLIELTSQSAHKYMESLVGDSVSVLVEGKRTREGMLSGLTDNYVRVLFDAGSDLIGEIVKVEVGSASQGALIGKLKVEVGGK